MGGINPTSQVIEKIFPTPHKFLKTRDALADGVACRQRQAASPRSSGRIYQVLNRGDHADASHDALLLPCHISPRPCTSGIHNGQAQALYGGAAAILSSRKSCVHSRYQGAAAAPEVVFVSWQFKKELALASSLYWHLSIFTYDLV